MFQPDETTFDNIVNSFVGIAAIQIGIVNILRVLEVPFDYCIGHSVGELGCAYADGTLTAEQMLLAAYGKNSKKKHMTFSPKYVFKLYFLSIQLVVL